MKSLLISIRPKWVEKILNGKKTLEIRKTAPKCDLPIDVYIYCTEPHAKEVVSLFAPDVRPYFGGRAAEFIERKRVDNRDMLWSICNGKVIAKFRLKHQFSFMPDLSFYDNGTREVLLNASCLSEEEIKKYANGSEFVYAWEISDLVIFDKPKELWEFGLSKAHQSWQRVVYPYGFSIGEKVKIVPQCIEYCGHEDKVYEVLGEPKCFCGNHCTPICYNGTNQYFVTKFLTYAEARK